MRAPKGIWGYAGGVRRLHVGPHEGLQGALRYVGSLANSGVPIQDHIYIYDDFASGLSGLG